MKLRLVIAACFVVGALVTALVTGGTAGAQGAKKSLYVIGAYETKGESSLAVPNFDDGAKLAVKDLEKKGWTVKYERIPAGGVSASSQEEAFLAAEPKHPDAFIALTSSNVFIPVGPKVAATDLPTFALASPTEGVRTGPSGGDNIFLLRPLNEQTYEKFTDYACKIMKLHRIGLSLVTTAFGPTVQSIVNRTIKKYKGCKVVAAETNGFGDTDMTQQILAFKDANVDAIMSANFPAPFGVLVNQSRQNGLMVPILGGASLNIAKDSGSLQSINNLVVVDDCVPELNKTKPAAKFVKAYKKEYGYLPNYASAQVYDAFFMAANAVQKAGHDATAINKAIAGTVYHGVCDYRTDHNNVMGDSVTVYKYNANCSKKFLKKYPIAFVPSAELATTTTTAAPATPSST